MFVCPKHLATMIYLLELPSPPPPPPRTESDLPFFCQKAQMTITELIKLYQWKTE